MSFTNIKLKGGKVGQVYQTINYFSESKNCKWCGKEIKQHKAVFEADGDGSKPCCGMAHAKAYMNAKI